MRPAPQAARESGLDLMHSISTSTTDEKAPHAVTLFREEKMRVPPCRNSDPGFPSTLAWKASAVPQSSVIFTLSTMLRCVTTPRPPCSPRYHCTIRFVSAQADPIMYDERCPFLDLLGESDTSS